MVLYMQMSHYNLCKKIISDDIEYAVIFEDDAIMLKDIQILIEQLYENNELIKSADAFILSASYVHDSKPVNNNILRIIWFDGTHALIINKRTAMRCIQLHEDTLLQGEVHAADGLYSHMLRRNNDIVALTFTNYKDYIKQDKEHLPSYIL